MSSVNDMMETNVDRIGVLSSNSSSATFGGGGQWAQGRAEALSFVADLPNQKVPAILVVARSPRTTTPVGALGSDGGSKKSDSSTAIAVGEKRNDCERVLLFYNLEDAVKCVLDLREEEKRKEESERKELVKQCDADAREAREDEHKITTEEARGLMDQRRRDDERLYDGTNTDSESDSEADKAEALLLNEYFQSHLVGVRLVDPGKPVYLLRYAHSPGMVDVTHSEEEWKEHVAKEAWRERVREAERQEKRDLLNLVVSISNKLQDCKKELRSLKQMVAQAKEHLFASSQ